MLSNGSAYHCGHNLLRTQLSPSPWFRKFCSTCKGTSHNPSPSQNKSNRASLYNIYTYIYIRIYMQLRKRPNTADFAHFTLVRQVPKSMSQWSGLTTKRRSNTAAVNLLLFDMVFWPKSKAGTEPKDLKMMWAHNWRLNETAVCRDPCSKCYSLVRSLWAAVEDAPTHTLRVWKNTLPCFRSAKSHRGVCCSTPSSRNRSRLPW